MTGPAKLAEKRGESSTIPLAEHPLLEGVEILAIRDSGEVICMMPTERIDHEDVPVKTEWAESLARQMRKSGQKSTITLAVIDGEPLVKIGDGFHREAGLVINGEPAAFASVEYMDWNRLYDHRIITAKDHVHVRFSRVVEWMDKVWEHSGLADKMTIEQAVLLYTFGTPGSRLGLDPDDVEAAKAWVARKEEQWEMSAMTFHGYLVTAQNVDPGLVHSTREKRHGKALEAPTQSIIKVFSTMLPNRFDLQNLVMQAAMAHNLKSPEVRALCRSVSGYDNFDDAADLVTRIDWENWEPEYGETKARALRRAYDPRHKGRAVLDKPSKDVANVLDRLERSIGRGEELTSAMRMNVVEARTQALHLQGEVGRLAARLSELMGESVPAATSAAVGQAATRAPSVPARGGRPAVEPAETEPEAQEPDFDPEEASTFGNEEDEPDGENNEDDDPWLGRQDVRPNALFDDDRFDEEPEDAEEAERLPTSASVPVPPVEITGETLAARHFRDELTKYLNGRSAIPPPINNRVDAARAERALREGKFAGRSYLREDIEELIANVRRGPGQRSA